MIKLVINILLVVWAGRLFVGLPYKARNGWEEQLGLLFISLLLAIVICNIFSLWGL